MALTFRYTYSRGVARLLNADGKNNGNSGSWAGRIVAPLRRRVHSYGQRTINLAEPCARPTRVQKLVSADVTRSCPHSDAITTGYRPTRVVPVRICKRKDLERTCRPKFCNCPQKLPPKTAKEKLCGLTKFGAKGALAAGLVYWTMSEGIWGDPKDTEDFYLRILETIVADSEVEFQLPRVDFIKFKILDSYNKAVLGIMGLLAEIPLKIDKFINGVFSCETEEDQDIKKTKK